jgi:hypothetical protein
MENLRKRIEQFEEIVDEMPCMSGVTKNLLKGFVRNLCQLGISYGYTQALKKEQYERIGA